MELLTGKVDVLLLCAQGLQVKETAFLLFVKQVQADVKVQA